jgi:hypothetical protein
MRLVLIPEKFKLGPHGLDREGHWTVKYFRQDAFSKLKTKCSKAIHIRIWELRKIICSNEWLLQKMKEGHWTLYRIN